MIIRILKIIAPFLLLFAGVYGAWKMIETKPEVETQTRERVIPTVRAINVEKERLQLTVKSQGTVIPRTVTDIVPEVAGKVIYVSPSLAVGGFFEEDEVLLRIDPHDYELAQVRFEAEVAQARLRLEQEQAEASVAVREWKELARGEEASPLVLREPQVAQAEAALAAAEAALKQARRDLERTEVKAPFAGRVRVKSVDIGQFVNRGFTAAELYAVEVAEVRLPLPNEDLAFVKIPLSYRGDESTGVKGPSVLLKAQWAGKEYVWKGQIVRTEGEIDTSTRMLYAIAQVDDPYGHGNDPTRPPLAVGMFVQAEILGNRLGGVIVLPRGALRGNDTVYVIDEKNRLRFRQVDVLKSEKQRVIIRSGIESGELVCISPIEAVVEGMEVKVAVEEVTL